MCLALDVEGSSEKATYQPGDHLAIYPKNDPELVKSVLKKLQTTITKNQVFKVQIQQNIGGTKMNQFESEWMLYLALKQ